ncbi:unnamed protein product [Diatraea saccharalis]|uniref:CHK kinase-like domain-containing protein n=1 Tax=Diatraea saccharalis TaxID=40085 RepID=A0A9N9RG11_9NEOP|nr:unnamed protein product [Diatraea saccharalis]
MTDAREFLLRKVIDDIVKQQNYEKYELKIQALPPTGANFTSQLFFVTISAPDKRDLHLFAKVAVAGETLRTQAPVNVYDIERHFYTKLANIYEDLQEEHKISQEHRLILPKFYGCNETYLDEVMVLQDFSAEGFTTLDRLVPFDWEYASQAVEQLAKLHALSIAYQEQYPDDYKEAMNILKRKVLPEDSPLVHMMQTMIGKLLELVTEKYRLKVQNFVVENLTMTKLVQYYMPLERPVLIHGDFRPSNLMHKIDKNGKLQVVIVDYQTITPGSVFNDLLYFIFTGSDSAFRQQYYHKLLEHYYQQLSHALTRLHLDPGIVFPKETFDSELKKMQHYGLVLAAMMLPMITLEQGHVQGHGYDSLDSMTQMMQHTSDLCAERFNEVVEDYVRWGLL